MATESQTTMSAEIAAAIERNLPAETGTLLRKRLEQAEKDAVALQESRRDADRFKTKATEQEMRAAAAEATLAKHAALAERETKVADAERALCVRQLQQELAAEKRISNTMVDVLGRLVRNVDYRSSMMASESKSFVMPGTSGNSGYLSTATDTSSCTTEKKAE